MSDEVNVRRTIGYGEEHKLPSRFWEPEPNEEDLKRMKQEYQKCPFYNEPLLFK